MAKKGSKEWKLKISNGVKRAYRNNPELRRKVGHDFRGEKNPFYGRHHSKKSIKQMSETVKTQYESGRKKLFGKANPMHGMSGEKNPARRPEVRRKLSKILSGSGNGMYGKHHTKEWCKRQSEFMKKNSPMLDPKIASKFEGELNPNWRGEIGYKPYTREFFKIAPEIRNRDGYYCQLCHVHQSTLDRKLDVHHIDYDKRHNEPNNLISLCRFCHGKVHFHRGYWEAFFTRLVVMKRLKLGTRNKFGRGNDQALLLG